jgi:hypothetical protein
MTLTKAELSPFAEWYSLRDQLVPYIGERVFDLLALAISEARGDALNSERYRSILEGSGNDVANPQVTETEQLLIDWARSAARDPLSIDEAQRARFERAFNPQLRQLLVAFTALMIATSFVATVG